MLMMRLAVAVAAVVAIVAASVALAHSSPPTQRVRVVPHAVRPGPTVAPSPELTTTSTTAPPVTTTTVPPPPPPPAPAAPTPGSYTVQAGDTLAAIAAAHGLDWPGVCRANQIADCARIYPGQVLELRSVPGPAPAVQAQRPTGPPSTTPGPGPTPAQTASSICDRAIPYLQANAAPGYTFTCAPGASEGPCATVSPHAVGCTVGGTTGAIYLDSNCDSMVPAMNEASNSRLFAGLSTSPGDPYGPARC